MDEKHKLFSASRTFFTAPPRSTTTKRRALSLEPRLSDYADEDEPIHPRRPSHSSPMRDHGPVDLLRGREQRRARLNADSVLQLDLPPQEAHLRTPPTFNSSSPFLPEDGDSLASPMGSSLSPRRRDSSTAGETHRVTSFDNTSDTSSSPSRGRMSARFSLASVSSSILEAVRGVSGPSRERGPLQRGVESRGNDHSHPSSDHLGYVPETGGLDNEPCLEVSGDGWHEFKKGTAIVPSPPSPPHTPPHAQ